MTILDANIYTTYQKPFLAKTIPKVDFVLRVVYVITYIRCPMNQISLSWAQCLVKNSKRQDFALKENNVFINMLRLFVENMSKGFVQRDQNVLTFTNQHFLAQIIWLDSVHWDLIVHLLSKLKSPKMFFNSDMEFFK